MGASSLKTLHYLSTPEAKYVLANKKFKGKYDEILLDLSLSNVLTNIKHNILIAESVLCEDFKMYYSYGHSKTTADERLKAQQSLLEKQNIKVFDKNKFIKPKHMPLKWYGTVYPYVIIFSKNKVIYKFLFDEMVTDKPWEYIYKNELLRLNQHLPEVAAAISEDVSIIPFNHNGVTQYFTTAYDSLGLLKLNNVNDTSVLIDFNNFRTKMVIEQLLVSLNPKLKKLKKYNRHIYINELEGTIFRMLSKIYRANEVSSLKINLIKDAQADLYVIMSIISHLFNTNAISYGHFDEINNLINKLNDYITLYIKYTVKLRDSKNSKK